MVQNHISTMSIAPAALRKTVLTSCVGPFINVDVIETHFMTASPLNFGQMEYNLNRQDAREGGESPPLPRNCERPWSLERLDQETGQSDAVEGMNRSSLNHWSTAPGR
jgi:hypothetical protein